MKCDGEEEEEEEEEDEDEEVPSRIRIPKNSGERVFVLVSLIFPLIFGSPRRRPKQVDMGSRTPAQPGPD